MNLNKMKRIESKCNVRKQCLATVTTSNIHTYAKNCGLTEKLKQLQKQKCGRNFHISTAIN